MLLQTYWSWCWPVCVRRVCSAKVAGSGWSLRNECGCALVNSPPTLRPDLDPMSKLGAAGTTTATVFGNAISAMNWWDPVMPRMMRRDPFDQDGNATVLPHLSHLPWLGCDTSIPVICHSSADCVTFHQLQRYTGFLLRCHLCSSSVLLLEINPHMTNLENHHRHFIGAF